MTYRRKLVVGWALALGLGLGFGGPVTHAGAADGVCGGVGDCYDEPPPPPDPPPPPPGSRADGVCGGVGDCG